jgi:nucleotide-binding universal stress UspA family protein
MFKPRRILHPTDYSDNSMEALRLALDLAQQCNSQILLVHVVETLGPENVTFGEVAAQPQPEAYRQRLMTDFQRRVPDPGAGVSLEYVLVEGDAAEAIVRVTQERSCDLIVMSTHGRTGLRRLLMGSVAEQVIRHAPCPILITKPP